MAFQLTRQDFQQIVRLLQRQPIFTSESQRRSLLTLAFGLTERAESILAQVDLSGTPMNVAVNLVSVLSQYGQVEPGVEALGVLLDQLLANMGFGVDADFLAEIISRYKLISKPPLLSANTLSSPLLVPHADERYVFISYAHSEHVLAEQVERYLQTAGFRTFRDTNDIRAGDLWDMSIEKALGETTHMALLLSAATMPYRKEVYREWFFFDQQRKPLIPLLIQDCTLHSRLSAIEYIDARSSLSDAMVKLIQALM